MADKKTNALILLPSSAIERIGVEPKRILSGMVSDALAVARSQERALAEKRFRVGNYEFCEPDYRQIMLWADALGFAPDSVIENLANSVWDSLGEKVTFNVDNGSIRSLVWDFELLPVAVFEWVDGLKIGQLAFKGSPTAPIALRLPSLHKLICANLGLTELDLSPVPELTELGCSNNQLTELDLSPAPELTELWCHNNQLTELDLSPVPKLTKLWCDNNQLTEIDIRHLLDMDRVRCDDNVNVKKRPTQSVKNEKH